MMYHGSCKPDYTSAGSGGPQRKLRGSDLEREPLRRPCPASRHGQAMKKPIKVRQLRPKADLWFRFETLTPPPYMGEAFFQGGKDMETLYDVYRRERFIRADGLYIDRDDLTDTDYMRRQLAISVIPRLLSGIRVAETRRDDGWVRCKSDIRSWVKRNRPMFSEMRRICGNPKMDELSFAYAVTGNMINGNARIPLYEIAGRHLPEVEE